MTSSTGEIEFQCPLAKILSFGYEEIILRSGTIIPTLDSKNTSNQHANVALMFNTGRLHFMQIIVDKEEKVKIQGNLHDLDGDGFSFPIGGIRRCSSSAKVEAEGETARSLGEGDHIEYLHQSKLLLYKCSSSPVVAFSLDGSGEINGSFEFLPHLLSKDVLGSSANGSNISGPYRHWIELGTICRDGTNYYRLVFAGRSTRMNQSKLIYMEFNEEVSRVQQIKTSLNDLPLALNSSLEGIAAFMTPHLSFSYNGMVNDQSNFRERIVLASIPNNGTMTIFGEVFNDHESVTASDNASSVLEVQKRQRALSDSILTNKKQIMSSSSTSLFNVEKTESQIPKFPLTMFERLINLSEKPEVLFGGDAVKEADITKRRLSMNSGEFVISPCKEGCTLTISLRDYLSTKKIKTVINEPEDSLPTSGINNSKVDVEKVAIVAVRVLLGSTTTDYLPEELAVMGRQVKLAQKMKRWYDIPFTDEEIMLAHRSGVVTISIGSSSDTTKSPPIIDSVEVYAQEREKLPHLFSTNENETFFEVEGIKKALDISILTITHMCNLLGNVIDLSSQINQQTLNRLIQVTALEAPSDGNVRHHVVDLVKSVEKDPHIMQLTLDEGTLQGISQTLQDLLSSLKAFPQRKIDFLSKVRDCLNVTLVIAKDRPGNYRNCVEKLISSKKMKKSITLQTKDLFDTKKIANIDISVKLMQLCIFEAVSTDGALDTNFASLHLVTEILRSQDECALIESCKRLAETLNELQTLGKVQAYKCDACEIFPITQTRYSLEDKNIDLCRNCFECGNKFARERNFASSIPVIFNGKQLKMEDNMVMRCSQIRQMTTFSVPSNICEQVEEAKKLAEEPVEPEDPKDDEEALNLALKMSMEVVLDENNEFESQKSTSNSVYIALITRLLEDLEQSLQPDNQPLISYPIPIVDLLLTMVAQSDMEDLVTFAKLICESFFSNVVTLIEKYVRKQTTERYKSEIR